MPSTNGHGSSGATERVALYLRVSSEEQRDRETIELQREFLEQYCNLHELEVTDVYEDNGVSGTIPVHERPEGRRLLEDAKGGGFGVVLVYRLDRGIVKRGAYSGTHTVNAHKEPIERKVPAIVEPGLQQKALARMEENRRFSGGRPHREYLLRGLVRCERCGALYSGGASTSNGYRYHYYSSQRNRAAREKRLKTNHSCARVRAEWLEKLVWSDVRSFLKNPREVLERVRVELAEDAESEDLEERHAPLARRLAAKQTEKGRYVKLYAQGHLDEEELEVHLVDLKNQEENLKLLIASVEADIVRKA